MWWVTWLSQTGPSLGPPGRVLRADAELSPRGEASWARSVYCTRGGGCCLNLPGGHIPASNRPLRVRLSRSDVGQETGKGS